MAQEAQQSQTGQSIAEIEQSYDLETMRQKALERQKKLESASEVIIPENLDDKVKSYLQNLHKDKTEQVLSIKTIYERAEHFLNKIETVEVKPLQITYDEAKAIFWKIYSDLLVKYQKEVVMTNSLKEVLPDMIRYFIGHEQSRYNHRKGLWVCGGIGTGKTTLLEALSIFTKALDYKKFDVVNCKSIVLQVRQTKDYGTLSEYIKKSLCYDDIAAEERTNIFGNTDEVIQTLLEDFYHTRFKKGHLIHTTSNVHLTEIGQRYTDQRLVSRITEMFNPVLLVGDDFRK